MNEKPILYAMVGLPGSGKTTKAKEIESRTNAIRFSPDDWQLRVFGDDFDHSDPNNDSAEHDRRHDAIEGIMREMAWKLLKHGVSVILDFGFWSLSERNELREMAAECHAGFEMYVMDIPLDTLWERIQRRNHENTAFRITNADLHEWAEIYEKPSCKESGAVFIR